MIVRRLPGKSIRKIGLTGSIGTGKSTVSKILLGLGIPVIDADALARKVVEPGSAALEKIADAFGSKVVSGDGTLDSETLGRIVFTDEKARKRLNGIVHPEVAREAERAFEKALPSSPSGFVFYDVPLLFETSMEDDFDLIVVVYAPRAEQERRLAERDSHSHEELRSRIDSQIDIEEKALKGDVILDNSSNRTILENETVKLVEMIQEHNERPTAVSKKP